MKILHTSDMHGEILKKFQEEKHLFKNFDIWVDTGDWFVNFPIIQNNPFFGWGRKIVPQIERESQKEWLKQNKILDQLVEQLDGRPFVSVQGNHDFISLADEINTFGYKNVYEVSPGGFSLFGKRWAGFPNIPYIGGEWNHETKNEEFDQLISQIDNSKPDILIMHAPCGNILDELYEENLGIGQMTNYLSYRKHNIKYVFHGHIHENGGKTSEQLGIKFFNGARNVLSHDIFD